MAKLPNVIPEFEGQDKIYYERLLRARDAVSDRMKFRTEEALDCSNDDKRGASTHMADVSSDNARREMELRLLTKEGNVIELIENAIARLIKGTYGKCHDCGERIAEARLEVRPYAILCTKCKSIREKNGTV